MAAVSATIKNNGINGLRADNNAAIRLQDVIISNNVANGIEMESGATIQWTDDQGSTITANGGYGMQLNDQVNSQFSGLDTVSGNLSQPDVYCVGPYWAATGVDTVGGTTNCVEMGHKKYSDKEPARLGGRSAGSSLRPTPL